jgi:hypothetical protein
MRFLEGKTSTERNKVIAAAILGVVSLVALYLAFGRSFFAGSSTTAVTVKVSPTPRLNVPPAANRGENPLPSADEQNFVYQTTPVLYVPGNAYAPDAGRNIFAFYEPPPPCKGAECPSPTPKPSPPPPTPTPVPTPPITIAAVPQSVYAGSKAFRLEVSGNEFPADARIYFNQNEMKTTYVNAQRIYTEIPANYITQEGPRQVIVQTPDGKTYSNQVMLRVQAPPKPTLQYIGMIGRKRYNNDTAYFIEQGNPNPIGRRLNDVVAGRFRLVDISPSQVWFEDVNLGFRHAVALTTTPAPASPGSRLQNESGFGPTGPGGRPINVPGIPGAGFVQPQPQQQLPQRPGNSNQARPPRPNQPEDEDDDGPQ